jgi:hypothetical protein
MYFNFNVVLNFLVHQRHQVCRIAFFQFWLAPGGLQRLKATADNFSGALGYLDGYSEIVFVVIKVIAVS